MFKRILLGCALLFGTWLSAGGPTTTWAQSIPDAQSFLEQTRTETRLNDYSAQGGRDGALSLRATIKRVIDWLKMALIPLCVILFVIAGIELMVGRGNEDTYKTKIMQLVASFLGFMLIIFSDQLVNGLFFGDGSNMIVNHSGVVDTSFAFSLYTEVEGFVNFITMTVVALFMVMVVISTYGIIFGSGSDETMATLRKRIIFGLAGIVVILVSKRLVSYFFVTQENGKGALGIPEADGILMELVGWLNYLLGFIGLLAVVAIIWAGIMMIVHFGNEDLINRSRKTIIFALVGIVLAFSAWVITKFFIFI